MNARMLIALLAALFLCTPQARGEEESKDALPMQFVFEDKPVADILSTIERFGDLTVSAHDDIDVTQQITLKVEGLTPREAIQALARQIGVFTITVGRTITLVPSEKFQYAELRVRGVVQSHVISDLISGDVSAELLAERVRSLVPKAEVKHQAGGVLVVRGTAAEHARIASHLRVLRLDRRVIADLEQHPERPRLRFFDVKDLVKKYDKLPARMRRLFPGLQTVDAQNGVLIVRGSKSDLDGIASDLDQLRQTKMPKSGGKNFKLGESGKALDEFFHPGAPKAKGLAARIESLRGEVRALRQEVSELRALLQLGGEK